MRNRVPAVPGVLSAAQVAQTARSIAATQQPSGAIPWFDGGHTDPWDHVQCAMALSAAGRTVDAARAYEWSRASQRPDGSWAIRYDGDVVTDPHTDSNFCAYVATGVWHHWRVTADRAFVTRMWPVVARSIELVLGMQRPDGAISWARGAGDEVLPDALTSGNASIHLSLRCAIALADVVGESRPDWELAAARVRHVLDHHPHLLEPKPTHSMDWYYPVLGGGLGAADARDRLHARWDEFVVSGLGARCVSDHPWVTGAETCELAMALDAAGRSDAGIAQLAAMQHLREVDGSYWTGLVFDDDERWPVERTTWTGATVVLAADALSRSTSGSGLFRGESLPACEWEVSDACPCPATS